MNETRKLRLAIAILVSTTLFVCLAYFGYATQIIQFSLTIAAILLLSFIFSLNRKEHNKSNCDDNNGS